MNLNDYIDKKSKEDIKNNETIKRNSTLESIAIEDFQKKFDSLILKLLAPELMSLHTKSGGNLSVSEIDRELSEFPYVLSYVLELSINHNIAQYFLVITANPELKKDGVFLKFESAGYARTLELKGLDFDKITSINLETYIVSLFQEFEKYD